MTFFSKRTPSCPNVGGGDGSLHKAQKYAADATTGFIDAHWDKPIVHTLQLDVPTKYLGEDGLIMPSKAINPKATTKRVVKAKPKATPKSKADAAPAKPAGAKAKGTGKTKAKGKTAKTKAEAAPPKAAAATAKGKGKSNTKPKNKAKPKCKSKAKAKPPPAAASASPASPEPGRQAETNDEEMPTVERDIDKATEEYTDEVEEGEKEDEANVEEGEKEDGENEDEDKEDEEDEDEEDEGEEEDKGAEDAETENDWSAHPFAELIRSLPKDAWPVNRLNATAKCYTLAYGPEKAPIQVLLDKRIFYAKEAVCAPGDTNGPYKPGSSINAKGGYNVPWSKSIMAAWEMVQEAAGVATDED